MALTFWQLPDSVKTHIFEYDDTYQQKMKEMIMKHVWTSSWKRFYNQLDCEYSRLTLDYLFSTWDIRGFHPYNGYRLYRKETTFPEHFRFIIHYGSEHMIHNIGTSIKVMNGSECLFDGWVLNKHEESEAELIDYAVIDSMSVSYAWESEDGKLFLWMKT